MTSRRTFLPLILGALLLASCSGDDSRDPVDPNSPEGVLEALQTAYRDRDMEAYSALLADDFRFYFDRDTREVYKLEDSWGREEELEVTSHIFLAPPVSDIRVRLTLGSSLPSGESGRETWLRNNVPDTFLEIDMTPSFGEPEGLTLRIDGHVHTFYFRKGKNPADALSTSETSDKLFLVEWRDRGVVHSSSGRVGEGGAVPVSEMTWSAIKMFFR